MNKEFIPYEQALAMKDLGFDESCIKGFYNESEIYTTVSTPVDFNNKKQVGELVSAPLYQQAFRWFRENYKLELTIQRMPPEVYGKGKGIIKNYLGYIWAENLNPRGQKNLYSDTHEEAELECLKKLIEIVKNK